ncbi:MAG: tyrosine-type recombinase/integrase [Verrucomicrobia bacterium]|nr:MAG: tyrosine-type recombinase/integrase [Verrucomicrobiota bacterium]
MGAKMRDFPRMKKPTAKNWTDPRTGKTYLRVRTTDTNGKSVSRMFTDPAAADEYVATLTKETKRHGRAAAVNSDEISGLSLWREFVAGENTAGRDAPALRDMIAGAIARSRDGIATPPLADLYKRFLDAREREAVSPVHMHALQMRLNRFTSYFNADEPAGAVTTDGVERAMASMRAGGLAPQTVKGIRGAAHGMFQWALDRNIVTSNPVTRSKPPKVVAGEVGTLTPSQLLVLLRTALEHRPAAVPALAVWAFCGVRRSELGRLRFEEMDRERAELRISAKKAKTSQVRYVPMPRVLMAWLDAAEAAGVAPLGKLVPVKIGPGKDGPGEEDKLAEGQINRWLREIRPMAGLTKWPKNALRHSFASYSCALHDDYPKVSAWLGHSGGTALLEARYRHAVPKNAGEKWFAVYPPGHAVPAETGSKPKNRKHA